MTRGDPDAPPSWLHCKKSLVPDMVARDPERMPVWEITGAEFSRSDHHTADGISIRFPRITKQRDDKTHREATNLAELNRLFQASKEGANLHMLTDGLDAGDEIEIKTKIQGGAHSTSPANKTATVATVASSSSSGEKKRKVAESVVKPEAVKKEEDEEDAEYLSPVSKKKYKINYKFEDTSSEDEAPKEVVAEKPSADNSRTTDTKLPSDTKGNAEKKPAARSSTTSPDIKPRRAVEPASLESTSNSKNRSDIVVSQKVAASATSENNGDAHLASSSAINIFEGVVLFVASEVRDSVKEEMRYFQLWGGQEAKAATQCSHALHANHQLHEEWSVLR